MMASDICNKDLFSSRQRYCWKNSLLVHRTNNTIIVNYNTLSVVLLRCGHNNNYHQWQQEQEEWTYFRATSMLIYLFLACQKQRLWVRYRPTLAVVAPETSHFILHCCCCCPSTTTVASVAWPQLSWLQKGAQEVDDTLRGDCDQWTVSSWLFSSSEQTCSLHLSVPSSDHEKNILQYRVHTVTISCTYCGLILYVWCLFRMKYRDTVNVFGRRGNGLQV